MKIICLKEKYLAGNVYLCTRKEAELQVELQRAKENPFYQRGTEGMACEPAPVAEPVFKRGSFAAAIRKHRAFQSQWQESINQKLDEREETRR